MRRTTNLSRLTAAARPEVPPGGVLAGRDLPGDAVGTRSAAARSVGEGWLDPEVVARAAALESTFDRGATAYLEDVLPELEELRQLLQRQILQRQGLLEKPSGRMGSEIERVSTWVGATVEPDSPQPRIVRELVRLVEEARSHCLGVPNPLAFRRVANRFSLFRVALEAEPAKKGARSLFS